MYMARRKWRTSEIRDGNITHRLLIMSPASARSSIDALDQYAHCIDSSLQRDHINESACQGNNGLTVRASNTYRFPAIHSV